MLSLSPSTVGLVLLFGTFPAGILIFALWDQRSQPSIVWLIVAMAAGAGWSVTWGLSLLISSARLTIVLHNIFNFMATLAAISWFLFAVEFSFKRTVSGRYFLALLSVPTITQALVWSGDPYNLVYAADSYVDDAGIFVRESGPWLLFDHIVFGYGLVVCAVGIWLGTALTSTGRRRIQVVWLVLATTMLGIPGVMWNLGLLPIYLELTPLGLVVAGLGFIILSREDSELRLFNITPYAREHTLQELESAVLTINHQDRIADYNPTFASLVDVGDSDVRGEQVRSVLADYPDVLDAISSQEAETEITLTTDGEERTFFARVSPVRYGRNATGTTVVLSEVTRLKEREDELRLLKQVFSRVFRHNFRNELMVVKTHARLLEEVDSPEVVPDHTEKIREGTDRLLKHSEKARLIESVVDDSETCQMELAECFESVRRTYESEVDIQLTSDVSPDEVVEANHQLPAAIQELVENAIEHGPSDEPPRVEISARRKNGWITVTVEDESGGLDPHEIEVLERASESDLHHGSGVGLWFVRWVVESSNGELQVEQTADGTRMGLKLRAVS